MDLCNGDQRFGLQLQVRRSLQMTVGQGNDTANVRLIADNRYDIFGVVFQNDPTSQLSWSGNGNAVFVCDPPVKNVT